MGKRKAKGMIMGHMIFNHETGFKTATYCLMHFIVAIAIAYMISGNWSVALSIGILEPLVQTGCYNMHERGWNKARMSHRRKYMDAGLTV